MANAAAKKAAAARASANSTYQPIFLGINAVYILLRLGSLSGYTIWSYLGIVALLGFNAACYFGILDSAESHRPTDKALIGGVWLDIVALVWLVQFGTAVITPKFYYLLLILPPWGAYKMYGMFRGAKDTFMGGGGGGGGGSQQDDEPEQISDETKLKREKRADRRRKKWS
eukprot:CAMPEP_0202477460 /NCGR_PEP_ID=MMETSP1360-20130828/93954_1 /ASSEMBLY_ACC=CAM_ASM_000848 /TAXON_ID=515479 /ORGANISM="Licmophora paradoxa, Strain CCMP2313" /LENGTH=170 /DNA_ID=CAMNT_0049104705 /DNA_START=13 /DNA_END=525 /DNA_ORIENTATION=+